MQNSVPQIEPPKMPENIKALIEKLEYVTDSTYTSRDNQFIMVRYKSLAERMYTFQLFNYDGSLGAEWYEPLKL